jgi:hypothetical protein
VTLAVNDTDALPHTELVNVVILTDGDKLELTVIDIELDVPVDALTQVNEEVIIQVIASPFAKAVEA